MKICILTQPLNTNYGGLLQAYALQTVLKRRGYKVFTEDRRLGKLGLFPLIKNYILKICGLIPFQNKFCKVETLTERQKLFVSQKTNVFIHKYLTTTEPIFSTNKQQLEKYNFDAYIVGSDQVWRPIYSWGLENYFLDFTKDKKVIRLAYAASFGTDKWEFSKKQTKRCSRLIKKFNAVSVRESSGVFLCKKYLDIKSIQVLDPTMLLEKEDYEMIVKDESEPVSQGNLFYYILDTTQVKQRIINKIASDIGLSPFTVMPSKKATSSNVNLYPNDCIFPKVSQWLRAFIDAQMVVTDSFHGCVFSIIFNKPFWVIGNKERGLARFDSLLSVFGLKNRLLTSNISDSFNWNAPIDWNLVNTRRNQWKNKSINFLFNNLLNK